jgi:uncharacterized MAPEG superfamily protein
MTTELTLLAWTLVLAIVQIMAHAQFRNRETGTTYNTGPRDEPGPPVGPVTGRLERAKQNLFETLPLFAAAVLIAHIAGRNGSLTHIGAWLYFIGRVVYVPLYAAGIPYVRSLVWLGSLLGLVLIIWADLRPV